MKLSKKHIIWGTVIVAGITIFFLARGGGEATLPGTTTIKRGDLIQEVSVTGRVKSTSEVNLSFERSGRVAQVYTTVGQHIEAGRVLAEIESSAARGSLEETEARLSELKRGARPEELAVKKAELAKYTQDIENTYLGVTDISNDAFAKADDALHTKTTGIFSGYKTSSYKYTFSICDSQLTTDGEALRYTSELELDAWRSENDAFSSSPDSIELTTVLSQTGAHLEKLLTFFDSVSRALTLDCTISNGALDTYRANINTARNNLNTALAAVNTKKQTISALLLTVEKVRNELTLLEAGSASETIAAQEARVLSARGELAKHRIVSPISGVVTKVEAEVGEGATVGANVFSIISDASFKIEAYVPEADIAKIKIGDLANVTLDAYGPDVIFKAKVSSVDPAETIIDNVPTYKTTLHFIENDTRIKSGMTSNTDIQTASRMGVLFAPGRSIISKNGSKYIRVVSADNTTNDVLVTTGLKSSDGTIEILTGLNEGDIIITTPTE